MDSIHSKIISLTAKNKRNKDFGFFAREELKDLNKLHFFVINIFRIVKTTLKIFSSVLKPSYIQKYPHKYNGQFYLNRMNFGVEYSLAIQAGQIVQFSKSILSMVAFYRFCFKKVPRCSVWRLYFAQLENSFVAEIHCKFTN